MNIKYINVGDVLVNPDGVEFRVVFIHNASDAVFAEFVAHPDISTPIYGVENFTIKAPEHKEPQTEEITGWRVWKKELGGWILLFHGKVFDTPQAAMASMSTDRDFYLEPITLKLERV